MFASLTESLVVTIRRRIPEDTDRYNNDLYRDVDTATRAWLSQSSSQEMQDDKQTRVTEVIFFFTSDEDLQADDRIVVDEVNGQVYEVIGKPRPAYDRKGIHHYEVAARLVEG